MLGSGTGTCCRSPSGRCDEPGAELAPDTQPITPERVRSVRSLLSYPDQPLRSLAALVTGLVSGMGPALQGSSLALSTALTESTRGGGTSRGRRRARAALVVAEIALTCSRQFRTAQAVRDPALRDGRRGGARPARGVREHREPAARACAGAAGRAQRAPGARRVTRAARPAPFC